MKEPRSKAAAAALFAAAMLFSACGKTSTPENTTTVPKNTTAAVSETSSAATSAAETTAKTTTTAAKTTTVAASETTSAVTAVPETTTTVAASVETTASTTTAEMTTTEPADTVAEEPPTESGEVLYGYEDSYTKRFIDKLSEKNFSAEVTFTTSYYIELSRFMVSGSDFYFGHIRNHYNPDYVLCDPGNEFSEEIYVIDKVRTDVQWRDGIGHYKTSEKGNGGSNSKITDRGIAATIYYKDMTEERLLQQFRADTDENGAPREWFGDSCYTYDPVSGDLVKYSGIDGMTAEYTFTYPCGDIFFDGSLPQYDTEYQQGMIESIYPWGPFADYRPGE